MGISDAEKVNFIRNLATMARAGIPLGSAVRLEAQQAANRSWRAVLTRLAETVERGERFSVALERFPAVFDRFFVHIVRAGETSGSLEQNFLYLADELAARVAFKKELMSALLYPAVMVSALLAAAFFFLLFVLPSLRDIVVSFGAELPLFTKIVFGISDALSNNVGGIALALVFAALGATVFFGTRSGRMVWDRAQLAIPIFGALFLKVNLVRFSRIFATLLKSGIPVHESLAMAGASVRNGRVRSAIEMMVPYVLKGQGLSGLLDRRIFPPMYVQMMEVGEKSASIEKHLEYCADFYQKEVERTLKNLVTLLEPALLVIIGIAVLFLALAVLGPIYQAVGGV